MIRRFEALQHRLLRAGVASRHVRRYLRELEDHFADLVHEESGARGSAEAAQALALARLGSVDDLAEAMLAHPETRSWTGRAPWATLFVGPTMLLALGGLLVILASVCGNLANYAAFLGLDRYSQLPLAWLNDLAPAMAVIDQFILPILVSWSIALIALRQRSDPLWPTLGLLAVATLGAGVVALHHMGGWALSLKFPLDSGGTGWFAMTTERVYAHRSHPGSGGAWSFSLTRYDTEPFVTPLIWFGAAWLTNLMLVLAPYRLVRPHDLNASE